MSYKETRSGCRRELGNRPPAKAVEWLDEQARNRNCHQFKKAHHYPQKWPACCYQGRTLICPPMATGEARSYFLNAKGSVFHFLGNDYKYLGQHAANPFRQHWEPFPFPKRKHKGKGKGKMLEPQHRRDDRKPEEVKETSAAAGGEACNWFK